MSMGEREGGEGEGGEGRKGRTFLGRRWWGKQHLEGVGRRRRFCLDFGGKIFFRILGKSWAELPFLVGFGAEIGWRRCGERVCVSF